MKSFEEYWANYGELHASFCNGDIKQFAKEIWESATGNVSDEIMGALESVERTFELYNGGNLSDMDDFRDWDSAFDEAQSKVKTALKQARGEE